MATVSVELSRAMGGGAPVVAAHARASETITSSASNQTTTITAEDGDYVAIVTTGNVYVAIGPAPVATSNPRRLVTSAREFGPLKNGDKVAVVDA